MAFFERLRLSFTNSSNSTVTASSSNPFPVEDPDNSSVMRAILRVLMSPAGFDRSLARQRVTGIIESGTVTTVTTVTTVSSITNVAAIGAYSAQVQVLGINLAAWSQCVRNRIS